MILVDVFFLIQTFCYHLFFTIKLWGKIKEFYVQEYLHGERERGGGGVNPLRNYCPKIIRGMMRRCRMICSLNLEKYFHEEWDIDGSSCSDDNVMNAC
jgi:hypothetical protein